MKEPRTRRVIDWGHLLLLGVFVAVVVAYLLDARATSLKTNNLLLVQPASFLALALAALVLPQVFVRVPAKDADDPDRTRAERIRLLRVGGLALALGAFVFSLERIGFDIATFFFTAVGLSLCGEKRLWVILGFSAVFTALVIYGYQQLVPYPFPLTVL